LSKEFQIKIDIDPDTKEGIVRCSHFELLRKFFSCDNDSANFALKKRGRRNANIKNYAIDKTGRFKIGFLNEIYNWAKEVRGVIKKGEFEVSPEAKYFYEPKFLIPDQYELPTYTWPWRTTQEEGVRRALKRGRGIINATPRSGKRTTFVCNYIENF